MWRGRHLGTEATNIGTHKRDAKELEIEYSWNGIVQIVPVGVVISEPMTRAIAMTRESRSANNWE